MVWIWIRGRARAVCIVCTYKYLWSWSGTTIPKSIHTWMYVIMWRRDAVANVKPINVSRQLQFGYGSDCCGRFVLFCCYYLFLSLSLFFRLLLLADHFYQQTETGMRCCWCELHTNILPWNAIRMVDSLYLKNGRNNQNSRRIAMFSLRSIPHCVASDRGRYF